MDLAFRHVDVEQKARGKLVLANEYQSWYSKIYVCSYKRLTEGT